MNGAKAEPCVRTIKPPSKIKKITIGNNHHFFRTRRNFHNSDKIEILDMLFSNIVFRNNF